MEAKSIFRGRNFREFLEKNRETAKIRENFSPRKFVLIKYVKSHVIMFISHLKALFEKERSKNDRNFLAGVKRLNFRNFKLSERL